MTRRGEIAGVRHLTSATSTTRKPSTVLTFTATFFHVLMVPFIATFPPSASAFHDVQDESLPTAAAAILRPSNAAQFASPSLEPRSMKCTYFDTAPLRTYCYVMVPRRPSTASEAKTQCQALSMNLVSAQTTTMDRLCEVVRRLGLETQAMWIDDAAGKAKIVSWDQRDPQDLRAKTAGVLASCAYCNIVAVCDVDFYHSNGPRCIAAEEGSERVEYCYSEQAAEAAQAIHGCSAQSAEPVNVFAMHDTMVDHVKGITRTDLEFWFDFQDKNVSALNGVVAFDARGIDWNVSCITVWFGRPVPWFFKRDCNETYPVVCENGRRQLRPLDQLFRRCTDQPVNTGTVQYCSSKSTFNTTSGTRFCQDHAMLPLKAITLQEASNAFSRERQWDEQNFEQFLIWGADNTHSGQAAKQTCVATSLLHTPPRMYERDCSEPHRYVCKYNRKATLRSTVRSRNYYALDQSSLSAKVGAAALTSCSCKSTGAMLGTCERSSVLPNWINDSLCISEKLRRKFEVLNTTAEVDGVLDQLRLLDGAVTTLPDIVTMPYHLSRIFDKLVLLSRYSVWGGNPAHPKSFAGAVIDLVHIVALKTKIWACLAEGQRLEEASNMVVAAEGLISRALSMSQRFEQCAQNLTYCWF